MKNINEENNEDISKKIPLDISEIKENNNNKSLFCSGVSLENNIEQKKLSIIDTWLIQKGNNCRYNAFITLYYFTITPFLKFINDKN